MVLPGSGKTLGQFQADDAACRQWAARQTGITTTRASTETTASGAAGGTAVGAASAGSARWSVQQRYDVAYMQCMYASGNQIPAPRGSWQPAAPPVPPAPPAGSAPPPGTAR